jgi:hypothetical protein
VAAIPDTGGARCAPHGVMRAVSRVVVLGGLVVTGWLLGSGVGLANEDPGQPGTGPVRLVSDPGTGGLGTWNLGTWAPGGRAAQADGGSGGQLGGPPTATSAVTRARSAVSVPRRSVPPPVRHGVLKPIVNAVGVPKLLAQVSARQVLATHVLAVLPRPAKYGAGIRSPAPADKPATIRPAESTVRAAAVTMPVPTLGPATVLTRMDHALPATPICVAAAPAAGPFAGQLALGDDPPAPVPVSPPGSTVSPCTIGSAGSGAGTKSAPDFTVHDSWASTGLALMHRLLYLSASDLPRSPAAQPSTSPD